MFGRDRKALSGPGTSQGLPFLPADSMFMQRRKARRCLPFLPGDSTLMRRRRRVVDALVPMMAALDIASPDDEDDEQTRLDAEGGEEWPSSPDKWPGFGPEPPVGAPAAAGPSLAEFRKKILESHSRDGRFYYLDAQNIVQRVMRGILDLFPGAEAEWLAKMTAIVMRDYLFPALDLTVDMLNWVVPKGAPLFHSDVKKLVQGPIPAGLQTLQAFVERLIGVTSENGLIVVDAPTAHDRDRMGPAFRGRDDLLLMVAGPLAVSSDQYRYREEFCGRPVELEVDATGAISDVEMGYSLKLGPMKHDGERHYPPKEVETKIRDAIRAWAPRPF